MQILNIFNQKFFIGIFDFIFWWIVNSTQRFIVLDGWRGLSILAVLACHLLPLGPKAWQLNEAAGPFGMALFFALSGFLITNFLIVKPDIDVFLVRRMARVLPLAWLCLTIALVWQDADWRFWVHNFLFVSNWPPMTLPHYLSPFWSLCVELQFYIGVALLILFFKDRGFWLIPFLCIAITLFRFNSGAYASINTYFRVDEILSGAWLALIYHGKFGSFLVTLLRKSSFYLLLILFFLASHPAFEALNYLRPYFAALLIGVTLYQPADSFTKILTNRYLVYIAAISYSLYLIHPLLAHSWLADGDVVEKYLKRPLLFVVLFLLAHLSTFYYERFFIKISRRFNGFDFKNKG